MRLSWHVDPMSTAGSLTPCGLQCPQPGGPPDHAVVVHVHVVLRVTVADLLNLKLRPRRERILQP